MVPNLAKTPLMAIVYASLLQFSLVFLPFSETYQTAMHQFDTPLSSYLFLIGYGLLISIVLAVAFASMGQVSVPGAVLTTITLIGLQWVAPAIEPFWFGDQSGIMEQRDLLLLVGSRSLCTILLVVLAILLFSKKKEKGAPKEEKPALKIKPITLIVMLIALPILFILLYLTCWYFFGWSHEIVRTFYGSTAPDEGFVAAVIDSLRANGNILLFCLLSGLGFAVLSLPLMTRFPDKKILFLALTVLLCLSPTVLRLCPTPLMPNDVRMQLLVRDAILYGVYGLLSSFLLHLSCQKGAATNKKKAARGRKFDDEGESDGKGPSPKDQAGAIRATMSSK